MTVKRTEKIGERVEFLHSGTLHLYVQLPDLFRSELESKTWVDDSPVKWIVVVNGKKGWRHISAADETEELSAKKIAAYKQSIQRFLWLRGAALISDPSYQLKALPELRIGDRAAVGVKLTHKEYPPSLLVFYAGRIARCTYSF